MKVKELIKDKTYPYIEWCVLNNGSDRAEFVGTGRCYDGVLIASEGNSYSDESVVVDYKEFDLEQINWDRYDMSEDEKEDMVGKGLTIVVKE